VKKYCIEGFFKALNENAELKRKFGEIRSKYRKIQLSEEESAEFLRKELIPFARNLGFIFNEVDYIEYQREKELEPLKDEELEMVSGGAGFFSAKTLGLAGLSLVIFSAPSVSNLNPFVSNKTEVSSQAQAAVLSNAYKENGLVYKLETNDENGDNIATVIRAENVDDVVIPGTISAKGRTFTVKAIGEGAFLRKEIRNITIPDSVETIGEGAFAYCKSLSSVNLGENSGLNSIKDGAFLNSSIRSINIPGSVKAIGREAFRNCGNLNSVNFGENSHLNSIGNSVFLGSSIRKITIPDSVQTIGETAFAYCKYLNSVNFGENSQLNSIESGAFRDSGIGTIVLPRSLEVIGNSVFKRSALCDINIPASVKTIGTEAFMECRGLNCLNFSRIWGEETALKVIEVNAFTGCSNLRCDVIFPDSLEIIGKGAFLGCPVNSFTFEVYEPNMMAQISDADFNRESTISVALDNIMYTLKYNEQGEPEASVTGTHKYFTDNENSTSRYGENEIVRIRNEISLGGKQYKVTSIAGDAFKDHNVYVARKYGICCLNNGANIKNVIIPASVKTIEKGAFEKCRDLISVKFEDNSDLETIEESAFSGCIKLRNISFGENSKLKTICSNAIDCSAMENLDIPDSVTKIERNAIFSTRVNYAGVSRPFMTVNFLNDPRLIDIDPNAFGQKLRNRSITAMPTNVASPETFAEEEAYGNVMGLYNLGYSSQASSEEENIKRLLYIHEMLHDEENTENEKALIKGLFTFGVSLGLSPEASVKICIDNNFVDKQLAFDAINEKIDSTPVLLSMGAKETVAAIEKPFLAESCILLGRHSIIMDNDSSGHKADGNLIVPKGAVVQELSDENSPGETDFHSFKGDLFTNPPSPADIRQGHLGNCYFLSALGAVLVKDPQIILNSMKDDGQGNVIVRCYHKNIKTNKMVPDYYKVKKTLPEIGAVNSAHWVRIFEKAYIAHAAKYTPNKRIRTPLTSIKKDSYRLIKGAFRTHRTMSHICGSAENKAEVINEDLKRSVCTNTGEVRQPGDYEYEVLSFFENSIKKPFERGTALSFTAHVHPDGSDVHTVATNVFDHHAYAVMGILPNQRTQSGKTLNLIKLRNPWGHTIPHYVKNEDGKWELKENTQPQDGVFILDLNQIIQLFNDLHSCKTK